MKKDIKKSISSRQRKAGALLALLIAGGMMKAQAEEIVATILFGPEKKMSSLDLIYTYMVDTNGDSIPDRRFSATRERGEPDLVFDAITQHYLKPGAKFIFEDSNVGPFDEFGIGRLISIEINGEMVELTKLFPRHEIDKRLYFLSQKLKREGRAR